MSGRGPVSRFVFKILCPEPLVSSLLGSRGATKDQIQQETGCRIVVSNRDEYWPGTRLRILVLHGDEIAGLNLALARVIDRVVECGEEERTSPHPHAIEPEFLGKGPGEYIIRSIIHPKASGAIIGARGANIQALRDEFNAKVFIEKEFVPGHQLLKVIAGVDTLRAVLARINEYVQQDDAVPDNYSDWSQIRNFESVAGGLGKGDTRRRSRSRQRRNMDAADYDGRNGRRGSESYSKGQGDAFDCISSALTDGPHGLLESEQCITCDLPRAKVSALIGKGGSYINSVRRDTGAHIHVDTAPHEDMQTISFRGTMTAVYTAHAMMMMRYHEDEMEKDHSYVQQSTGDENMSALQVQLQTLQNQVNMLNDGGSYGGKGYGKGKGKGNRK